MSDEQRRIRRHVHEQIDRNGWGPGDALAWAADRDLVGEFRAAVAFARLCQDGTEPHHRAAHRNARVRDCVGPGFVDQMARKFGFSEERTKLLLDQFDQELAAFAGLQGAGGD